MVQRCDFYMRIYFHVDIWIFDEFLKFCIMNIWNSNDSFVKITDEGLFFAVNQVQSSTADVPRHSHSFRKLSGMPPK